MPALRSTDRVSAHMATRGTRVPAGVSLPRPSGQATYREAELWPGITWGRSALCSCSWAFRGGIAEVKARSTACDVHVPGRKPGRDTAGPLPAAPSDDDLLAAIRAGTVTWELYLSSVRSWRDAHEATLLAAELVPQITELADLLAPPDRPASYCRCGRPHDIADRDGHRRCRTCRRLRDRESAARCRARRRAAGREWQEAA